MRLRTKYCIITKYDECDTVWSIILINIMPGFYNEGRQVCHVSCLCKDTNMGWCDDLVRVSIIVQKKFILTQTHITIDEP